MFIEQRINRKKWQTVLLTIGVLLSTLMAEAYIYVNGFSYREAITGLIIAACALSLGMGERGIRFGVVALTLLLALGHRTMTVTPYIKVYPAELVLCGLLLLLITHRELLRFGKIDLWLPLWLWLFIPCWIWGWWQGLEAGRAWDKMFAEFRAFLILVPLFIVIGAVLINKKQWRNVTTAFYCVGTWIAGLGVAEHFIPGLVNYLPGFLTVKETIYTPENFDRAKFSFFGGPEATFILVLTAPLALVVWRWSRSGYQRGFAILAFLLQILAIYIGGFRSMWMVTGILFVLFALLQRNAALAIITLFTFTAGLIITTIWLLPEQALKRAQSLFLILSGTPTDSSGQDRLIRVTSALDSLWADPLGLGWAGAGWVHNDFLQVAANLGVIAGVIFFGAYLLTLTHLFLRVWRERHENDEWTLLGRALLLSFVAAGANLFLEDVQNYLHLILPVWLVWVLAETWLRQLPKGRLTAQ